MVQRVKIQFKIRKIFKLITIVMVLSAMHSTNVNVKSGTNKAKLFIWRDIIQPVTIPIHWQ